MKKNKIYFIIFAFQFVSMFVSFAIAQEESVALDCWDSPAICSIAPREFLNYVNFTREMLLALKDAKKPYKQVLEFSSIGGLFSNQILEIPWENKNLLEKMVSGVAEWISRRISRAWWVADILSTLTYTSYKDVIWLSILFQSKPIVRDWKTLLDLETEINQSIYEMSLTGLFDEIISDQTKINNIINKYIQENPFLATGSSISPETKYKDVLHILIRINWAMKTFLPYSKISQFDEFSRWKQWEIYLKFNPEVMSDMKDAYACGRFFKCSSPGKDFVSNLKKVLWSFMDWWSRSWTVIKDANIRLSESIKWISQAKLTKKSAWEEYLTDTEIELLRSVYGIDTSKLTKQQWISLRDVLSVSLKKKSTKDFVWPPTQQEREAAQSKAEEKEARKKAAEQKKADREKLKANADLLEASINQWDADKYIKLNLTLIDSIEDTIKIVDSQQQKNLLMLSSNDTAGYLHLYTLIGNNIRKVIDIIWTKDKNIVKNLGNVCEIQCSNKWVDGCFAPLGSNEINQ